MTPQYWLVSGGPEGGSNLIPALIPALINMFKLENGEG
jgi:hypothetical protein